MKPQAQKYACEHCRDTGIVEVMVVEETSWMWRRECQPCPECCPVDVIPAWVQILIVVAVGYLLSLWGC